VGRGDRVITLISCCGPKSSTPTRAADLYRSTLFRKSRQYAEHQGGPWFILSALHGLVDPDDVIAPYDVTLADLTRAERVQWGRRVAEKLREHGHDGGRVRVLAGRLYVEPLRAAGLDVDDMLAGLEIGQRLQFLTRATAGSCST
jgi:hypothetical protein